MFVPPRPRSWIPYCLAFTAILGLAGCRRKPLPAPAPEVESQRQALVHGLLGEYFDNADLTGLKRSKIDEIVDFDWVNNPPTTGDGIGADTFSVRWTGFVEARFTETYTFITRTDDGVRLWVNGTQIINDWNNHSITERQGTIALTAGERVPIRLEYYDNTGNASAHLRWKSAHEPEDAIPTAQLTSPVPTCNDSPGLVSHWRFDEEPAAPSPGASFTVLENDYDGPQWWGTIKFRNEGPSTSSNFKVEFDVPSGVHCTADAVPQGATLTPLTGSGTSAHTTGSHCIFTWTNTTALAKGGTKTFNYSTDSQSFDEALSVTVSDPTQGSAAPALTVFDDTCNLNHGSLRSPGTSPRQAGLMGGALGFSNQMWVRVPFSLSLDSVAITNKVSVAAWVKPSSLPSGWVSIVSRQFQTSGLEHFGLAFRDGKVTFGINTQEAGTPNKTCSAPTVSPTGTWLHVAGTFDGTTARAYVDGQEVCSFSRPVNLHADTTPLTIGGAYNTPDDVATELFSGLIDDVSVYNRTLTPVEINAISGKPRALLVVRDVVNLGADELLHERLEHLGYMVEPVAANLASTAMATGKAVVVISESGNSGDVGTKFRDVSTPVVNLEVADWKFMNMAGSTTGDTGNVQGQASITILSSAAGHPLAAGLTGGVTATKTGSKLNWAKKLGNGVTKIATLPGDATRVTIFGYEIGSALISGTAAGRRVGMFLSEPATAEMTVATGELFDAAVKWAAAKPALLVVQTNTMVLPSDQKLRERLESLGLPVVVKQDGVVQASDANGKQVVVISESVNPGAIGDMFTNSAVPVVTLELNVWDDMKLVTGEGGTASGNVDGQDKINILDGTHPLAAGFSTGPLPVTTTTTKFNWAANPAASAVKVASLVTTGAPKYAILGYEKGSALVGGTPAPARRVGMYLRLDTPVLLNADGWRLFDAAVLWGAGRLGQDAAACVGIAEGGDCATGPNECDEGICQAGKCVPPPGQSPTCQVEPQLTCVIPNPTSGADYTAVFGYTNRRPQNVYAPAAATDNFVMRPGVDTSAARWFDVGQPGWFKGATASQPNQPAAFTVDFNTGDEVSWTLGNRSPVFASADWAAVRQCTVNPNGPDGPVVVIGGKEYPVGLDPKKIIDHGSVPTDVLPDPSNPPGFAAGTTVGSLNVTTDGMATYSIPIQVPAGRRGIQPQISLSYRSRGGNGLPGVGWTIAGLSDIEVCPTNLRLDRSFSTGQPENRPITFNGTDPMCLDGSRLIETTSLVVGSDAYLKAVVPQDREYRTERTDGSRVIARGPSGGGIPLYFEVGTRDGRVLTYGIGPSYVSTHDSHKVLGKPLRVAQMAAAQQVVAAAWPLTQVRDRFGNRMDILYEVDADHTLVNSVDTWYEKERRPKEILYTGFGTEVGPRAVKFEYAMNARAPEDQLNLWFAGTNRRMTKLLTRIETYAPEISSTGTVAGSRLIRFYKLTHSKSPATGRMRLGTASECEPGPTSAPGDDACLKGLVFDYERGESDFEVIDVPEATDVFTAGAETDHGSLSTADLDGDGRADIIYAFKDGNARKHHYWLSNADKYGAPGENAFKLDGIIDSSQGYKNEARNLNVWTADLDGDGRAEIFVPASEDLKPTVETFNPLFTYLPYRVTSSGLTPFSPTELPGAPVRPFPGLGTRVAVAEPRELSSLFVIPIDRRGEGRPGLAILRPLPPPATAQPWRCESLKCPRDGGDNNEYEETGCTSDLADGKDDKLCDVCKDSNDPPATCDTEQRTITRTAKCWHVVDEAHCIQSCAGACSSGGCVDDCPNVLDANPSGPSSFQWDYRRYVTSTELALDGSEARTAPDPTSRAVGGEDPEGDGTQDLADTRRDLARADINGDGLTDRENTLATGVGTFASQGGQPIASNIRRQNLRVMDYDGDGRSDFLVVQKRASSKMAVMRWMNGSWSEIPLDIDVGHEASGPQAATAQFECKSAPGLGALITDSAACADHPDRNYCRWTNSPHFEDSAQVFFGRDGAGNPNQFVLQKAFVWGCTPTGLVFSGTTTPEPEYRTTQVLDWNGDGLMDIITVDTSGHLKVYKRKGKKADLLVRVQDGFFANTQVTYAPMSDAATYTPGSASDCKYPLRCLRSGNWLVSTSSVDTGVNGEDAVSSYKYTDARSDMRGRGWLGMQKQETTREVDFTNPAPEGTTKFTEKRVTEFGHAFTLDRDAFPLAQFVTRVRSSTIGTTAGLTSGTEQAMTPEIFRGTAGVDPGSPPVPPYILVGSTSDPSLTPSVNVLDHQKNTLVYFVNTARTTTREFQNDLTDPFPGEEKRKTVVERERDLYGNVTKERTFVWARAKKGAPLPPDAEWLSRTENESTFEGNASAFKESRFLGLAQRLISNHSLRPKTGPVVAALPRIVEQTFTASRATIDSTKTQPDAPDGSDEKLLTSTDRLSLYGLPEVVSMTGSGKTRTTQTRYDGVEHMYAEETIDPEGHTTRLRTIPGIDRVAWSQDANGIITRMQYDGFGRPRTVDGPASADVTITYDFAATGNLRITTTKTSGERTVVEHDELVRPISVERRLFASGTSSIETTEYDPLGRVRRVTGPYGEKIVRFDRIGRVIEEHRPDEAMGAGLHLVTETHYDDYFTARVVTQAGRVGQVLTREQSVVTDALGQMTDKTEKVDGHTVTTSYEYKPFGLIAKVSHGPTGAQSTTTMDYDVLGRRKTLETPDTGKTTTLYNAFGEPREETDADGNVMTLDHDGLGRVVKRTDKKGTAVSEATFVFDRAANGVGQLGEATQGSPDNVKTVLSYEPVFGAVSSSDLSVPDGSVTRTYSTLQSYDSFGRADTVSYPETPGRPRFTVRNVYGGANGLLSEIRDITGGADNLLWKADEREPLGRIQQERLGNGVISTRGYAPETGRLTSINAGAGMVQNLSYKYYADGTVFLRHDVKSGLRERFEYDGVGRLDGWMKATANDDADPQGWSVAWTYDDRGNLTKRVVTGTTAVQTINQGYNGGAAAPHRLDTSDLWPAQTFGYDLLGNVKSHPGVGTIDYTAFNLPRKVTSSSFTKNYLYDAFGTRVRNGTGGDSITYVGGLYERRTDGNDVIHIHYVRADGRLVTQVSRNELSGTDESTYVYSDHLGSTQVVQSASGALTERRQDPFGNPLAWNGTTLDPRIGAAAPGAGTVHDVTKGFTGAEEEGDLGVVNMGGRIYDPRLGRFLQADPLVSAPTMSQGWNRYAYGLDNPMRFIDPTGFVTAQTVEEDARAHELSVPDYCAIYQVQCAQQRMGSDNPQLVYQGIAEEGAADHVAWLHQAVEGQRGWEAEQQRAKVSNREMAQEYLDRAKDPRSTKVVPAEELVLAAAQIVGSGLQKTANVKGFVYNPDEAAAAHWDKKTGYIVIGKQAFTHGVGDLQSTIRHELVHAKQDQMGYAGGDRTRQRAYNEIEAYYTQLAHARADGTSEQMQKDVQSMIGLYQKFLDGLVTWDGVPIK